MLKLFNHIALTQRHNNKSWLTSLLYKRNFLSNAYDLDAEFEARLKSKIIQRINPSNMYLELDQQFNRYKKLHAIDVDLFVNSITSDIHSDELEDILYKFRLTPCAADIFPSTQHTVIRLYTKLNKFHSLLKILDDRLNYGIFPDDYCNNFLLNYFITQNNFRDAAKMATAQMLQEDFSNEITKYLSLYACMKYLQQPSPWVDAGQQTSTNVDEDDDEEVKVRVRYLRNPYFDGHFDLRTPNDLIGKTFITIGRENDDVLSKSYYLIGLALMKNVDESKQFLQLIEDDKVQVSKDSLELFKNFLTINIDQVASQTSTEASGENESKDSSAVIGEEIQAILDRADKVLSKGTDLNLLQVTESKAKEVVEKFETQEIDKQKHLYKQWELNREEVLQKHLETLKQVEIFDKIEKKKIELAQEEERLFFFDNENELDLKLEEKYPKPPVVVVKKRNEFDGMRNKGRANVHKVKKKVVDETYMPPDLHKPYRA